MTDSMNVERKINAGGWGTSFIWMGLSLLLNTGWGIGLLGIGVITLAAQAVRRYFDLPGEAFWIIAGLLFLIGGLGAIYGVDLPLVPLALMLAGAFLLLSLFGRGTGHEPRPGK